MLESLGRLELPGMYETLRPVFFFSITSMCAGLDVPATLVHCTGSSVVYGIA